MPIRDAVQLFIERARRAGSELSLTDEYGHISRIIRLVDGTPLAIEMAAAWLKTMTCEQIADAIQGDVDFLSTPLRNVPERHQSIRAVFDRSWQRLTDEERAVFRKLSVFRGGFTFDAAKQAVGTSRQILAVLCDKSLLQLAPNGRYDLHELLRQYSTEQLELAGEVDASQYAHAVYFAAFMQQGAEGLKSRDLPIALKKIKADWDNVRAACSWLIARRDVEHFDQLLEGLWLYGLDYRIAEVKQLWQKALDQFAPRPGETPSLLWGRLLTRTADIFELRGPSAALASGLAQERVTQGLEIAYRSGDAMEIAVGHCARGQLFRLQGKDNEALKWYTDAICYNQQSNNLFYLGAIYHWIGLIQQGLGQLEDSLNSFQRQLELSRTIGDSAGIAWALLRIGVHYRSIGRTQDAVAALQESEKIHRAVGNTIGLSNCAGFLANLALLSGDLDQARVKVNIALRTARDSGAQIEQGGALDLLGMLACFESDPGRARQIFAEAESFVPTALRGSGSWGLGLVYCEEGEFEAAQKHVTAWQRKGLGPPSRTLALALSLPEQAVILAHQGEMERAVELLGLAAACPAGWMGWMAKWPLLTQLQAEMENKLGMAVYQAAWERGKTLDLEKTVTALII